MTIRPDKEIMKAAIIAAETKNTPFGAALAMGDQVFVTATHQAEEQKNPELHAVVRAIHILTEQLQTKELSGYTLYSTCRPCAVCVKRAVESGIETVIYGCIYSKKVSHRDQQYLSNDNLDDQIPEGLTVQGGLMEEKCIEMVKKLS